MTRRSAMLMGLATGAFAAKEFWNARKPEEWTGAEIKELLTRSPWAKDGEIKDNGQVGSVGAPRGSGRRGATINGGAQGGAASNGPPKITWKAMVRWDSGLPVREALKGSGPKDVKDFYVLNVLGNLPSAIPSENEPADRAALEYLKETTKLQHKGDEIHLSRVERAPASERSEAGTWFYFSRMLDLMPGDREATFVTKIGPLDVKCKFTLKDMVYRGNLEL